jgi:hypothetical protein
MMYVRNYLTGKNLLQETLMSGVISIEKPANSTNGIIFLNTVDTGRDTIHIDSFEKDYREATSSEMVFMEYMNKKFKKDTQLTFHLIDALFKLGRNKSADELTLEFKSLIRKSKIDNI